MRTLREFFGQPGGLAASAGFAALFSAGLALYAFTVASPPAFDPLYSLYLDSTSFYWIQALWDRGLFAGDELVRFYLGQVGKLNPEVAWVWITSLFMTLRPYTAGLKLLGVLACAASALMVRRLALAGPARPAAAAAVPLFAVLFLSMDTFFGAPRIYGALCVFAFAWALEERRYLLLPGLVAICFAFYPAAAAGLGLSAAAAPFFEAGEFSSRRLWGRYLGALAAAGLFCGLVLAHTVALRSLPEAFGKGSVFEAHKLYQQVDSPVDPGSPADAALHFVLNVNEHGPLYAVFLSLLSLACALGLLCEPRRPRLLPRAIPVLLAGCGAAFLLLYGLHPVSASRQLATVVPLALVFLAAEGLLSVFQERYRPAAAAAALAGLFACLHPFLGNTISMRGYAGLYGKLDTLPGAGLVAGYPASALLATVPVFTGRSALAADGTADQEMMFLGGPAAHARRRRLALQALYCASPGAAAALAGEGAGWLLVERHYYDEPFLSFAGRSGFPEHLELGGIRRGAPPPPECYEALRRGAFYEWEAGGGGFLLPLGPAGGGR